MYDRTNNIYHIFGAVLNDSYKKEEDGNNSFQFRTDEKFLI